MFMYTYISYLINNHRILPTSMQNKSQSFSFLLCLKLATGNFSIVILNSIV